MTYNKVNTYDWFKENLTKLADIEDYDFSNKNQAIQTVMDKESMITGIIYQDKETPSYEQQLEQLDETPLVKKSLKLEENQFEELVSQLNNYIMNTLKP